MGQEPAFRILVADDEPHILRPLTFVLKKAGYDVSEARNGQEALDRARAGRPDLVFLDVMMPKMSGFEVCQAIRNDSEINQTRIIFLSAKGQESDIAHGLEMGANDYITKPFSPQVVLSKVQEILSR